MKDLKTRLNEILDWIEAENLQEAYNAYALQPENAGKPIAILVAGFYELHTGPATEFYYTFDCMNAFLADKLFPAATFEGGDREAIRTAENYEATLYKHRFCNGEKVLSIKLYDPWDIFDGEDGSL